MSQIERLKLIRKQLGLSQAQLAKKINFSLSTLSAIEAGNQKFPIKLAYILQDRVVQNKNGVIRLLEENQLIDENEKQLNADWLFRGQGDEFPKNFMDCSQVSISVDNDNSSIDLNFSSDFKFIKIKDKTMIPFCQQDDIIVFNPQKNIPTSGNIYLLNIFSEQVVRFVYKLSHTQYKIVAVNEQLVPPIVLSIDDFDVLGEYQYMIRLKV